MAAVMRKRVEPIPGTPHPHGILNACTTVVDVRDVHELIGVEWMALGCCPVRQLEDPCLTEESPGDESPGEGPEQQFCRPEFEHAVPITLSGGTECSTLGWTHDEAVAHTRATMELGEQHGLESGFMRGRLTTNVVDATPPGGPLTVAQGVAALEGCLAESYGGTGVLHVPMGVSALLDCCNLLHEDPASGNLRTLAGTCAVIGGGYTATGPGGIPAEPGTSWLYITGPVHIRRGPLDVLPDQSASVNIRTNDRRIRADRTYVVGTTCTVCAVQVVVYP